MTKKNYSLYGLPEEVRFCSKCTISNQRPSSTIEFIAKDNIKKGIEVNSNNICDACKYNDIKNKIDWEEREKKLNILLLDHLISIQIYHFLQVNFLIMTLDTSQNIKLNLEE